MRNMQTIFQLINVSLKHFQATGSTFIGHPSRFRANPVALAINNWTVKANQHWLITGTNGQGKSLLAKAIARKCQMVKLNQDIPEFGLFSPTMFKVYTVSVENESTLLQRMRVVEENGSYNRFLLADLKVSNFINYVDYTMNQKCNTTNIELIYRMKLVECLNLKDTLDNYVFQLSTGELRKLLLVFTLTTIENTNQHKILILDELYDGIDIDSKQDITELLMNLVTTCINLNIIIISHRIEPILKSTLITNYGLVKNGLFKEIQSTNLEDLNHSLTNTKIDSPFDRLNQPLMNLQRIKPLIEVKQWGLSKELKDNVSFVAYEGDRIALVGPNGCGKTTLLSLIACQNESSYGVHNIFINETSLAMYRLENKKDIEFYFVSPKAQVSIFNSFKVMSPFVTAEDYWKGDLSWIKYLMKIFNLEDDFKQKLCCRMSQGEQRKTFLIYTFLRVLETTQKEITKPTVLILDEPFHGLDTSTRTNFFSLLEDLVSFTSLTIFLVTHNNDEIPPSFKEVISITKKNK